MTLVGTAFKYRGEDAILSSSVDVLQQTSNLAISRCRFVNDGKELDKSEKRTCGACKAIVFAHLNMQICDVLVAVAVVVA